MLVSPNKVFTVVRDDKNRVMVVDNISGSVVQAWRGYHRCEMAWSVTSVPGGELTSDTQLSLLLLLYLPRRGLIEVSVVTMYNDTTFTSTNVKLRLRFDVHLTFT